MLKSYLDRHHTIGRIDAEDNPYSVLADVSPNDILRRNGNETL